MLNINFVPDDYVQNGNLRRMNLMYLVLLLAVMATLGGSFVAIKTRQRALVATESLLNQKMSKAQDAIKQFEQLQSKRKEMMKTALMTSELLEPVPRSVMLAALTNSLPTGASLLRVKLVQKAPKTNTPASAPPASVKAAANKAVENDAASERLLETHLEIEGIAPSDLQVAVYIERLSGSALLDGVALVESKEYKSKNTSAKQPEGKTEADSVYRQFKLTAMLKKNAYISKEEIKKIACNIDAMR
jgi:Tfp pilus assembly protein PilN